MPQTLIPSVHEEQEGGVAKAFHIIRFAVLGDLKNSTPVSERQLLLLSTECSEIEQQSQN